MHIRVAGEQVGGFIHYGMMPLQDFAVKPSTLEKLCLLRVFLSNNLHQEIKMRLGFYPADPLLPSLEPRALDHGGIQAKQHSKVERGVALK